MLLQIVGHGLAYSLLYGAVHLRVTQFRLGLSLKLRLCHLHRDNGCQTLAEVILCHFNLGLLNLLTQLVVFVGVFLQRTCQSDAEARQVGTTLDSVDIVDVRVDILRVVAVVEQCHLDGHTVFLCLQADGVADDRGAVTIDVAHELLQSLLGVEHLGLLQVTLFIGAQVGQRDGDTSVQISELAHTAGDDVVFVFSGGKDGGVGPELLARTCKLCIAYNLYVVEGLTLLILLLVDVTVAEHL